MPAQLSWTLAAKRSITVAFERVYTVDDWYDGARGGAADYHGQPHAYRSLYLDSETWDLDEDRFELREIDPEVLAWILERDALFRRWESANSAGHISDDATGEPRVLPPDRARAEQLDTWIAEALGRAPHPFVVRGTFEYGAQHGPASARVRWSAVESPDAP